jgi:uncharacterized protein
MIEVASHIIYEFWIVLCEMSPYLLLGFFIAGLLSVMISPKKVQRHLGGEGFWPVIKATLFGVPLPLCSCGVIPVSASLRRQGAGKGATMAFLLSTPQTGADSIAVTYSLLGPVFALFRPLAAFFTGIVGGMLTKLLTKNGHREDPVESDNGQMDEDFSFRGIVTRVYRYSFITLPKDISKTLLTGLLLAGLISALVPEDFFAEFFTGGFTAMLAMMALGIPIYVCATASVPIAAVLIMKGVSPGAALVFLLTGPATNAATISTIWKILGKSSTVIYLAVVSVSALGSGLLIDYLYGSHVFTLKQMDMEMGMGIVKPVSAVILLVMLGYAVFRRDDHVEACGDTCCKTKAPRLHFMKKITQIW